MLFFRQHKLEEALLFSGQFMDALQALVDWLYKVEPQLAEDQPVHGDLDLVMNLMDAHKVRGEIWAAWRQSRWGLHLCVPSAHAAPSRGESTSERAWISACHRGGSLLCVLKQTAARILHWSRRIYQNWLDSDLATCQLLLERFPPLPPLLPSPVHSATGVSHMSHKMDLIPGGNLQRYPFSLTPKINVRTV